MKTYADFMNELKGEEIFQGLLEFGMFSEKLPPIFDGQKFFDYCKKNSPTFNNTKKESNYIKFETMRNINIPRCIGIPNPMNYYRLCKAISDNWNLIQKHFGIQTQKQNLLNIKVSKIHIRKMKEEKKIFEMNYKDYRTDGNEDVDFLLGAKYVISADISTCFPSMYTHSLPWALVGKSIAKNKRSPEEWFNQLDFYARGTTNGETHGILIGPHASNVLSEIILTSIDNILVDKGWNYIRNIDDYTCYVNTHDEAQKFLTDINEALRTFNLMLNHKKTKVSKLPQTSTEDWIRKLNGTPMCNKEYLDYKDVKISLDIAVELVQTNNNNAAIFNYLIKVVDKKKLSLNAIKYYSKNILHLSIIFPYLIPLLDEYIFIKYNIHNNIIIDFTHLIYEEGRKTNNYEMLCYSLFFAIKYKFKISIMDSEKIRETKHCILMLLGYLYNEKIEKSKKEAKEYKNLAKELIKNEDDFNENWVLVYEVLTAGLLKSDWKSLKQDNVSFLKDL